jgi:F-type H+-transporting ATPase subunit a
MEEHTFNWIERVFGVPETYNHLVTGALVVGLLIVTTAIARLQLNRSMKREDGGLIPESTLTYRNFFELVAENLYSLTESVLGQHDAHTFFPLIGSLFLYIFASNLVGLIPGMLPPTDNLNCTFALGAWVFLYYNFSGFRANGPGYLKHFMGPVWWLAPLMVIIEVVSHLFRPFSLALRLRGNIMGDHLVLGVFSGLVPYLLPVIFYGLGVFVSFIQSFVFCLMTMVYISMSTAHEH